MRVLRVEGEERMVGALATGLRRKGTAEGAGQPPGRFGRRGHRSHGVRRAVLRPRAAAGGRRC